MLGLPLVLIGWILKRSGKLKAAWAFLSIAHGLAIAELVASCIMLFSTLGGSLILCIIDIVIVDRLSTAKKEIATLLNPATKKTSVAEVNNLQKDKGVSHIESKRSEKYELLDDYDDLDSEDLEALRKEILKHKEKKPSSGK